ncbi:MAG: aminotransferase class V-fold PLP-dependent enzyme, partial [bacterium]|nr:aminotransferase class V-fold PLP-dependent enzyme [bacterium]
GSESIRYIPVDKDYRINPEVLKETIAADRAAGYFPFCIVGNAGTVNTGAIDPLEELSQICKAEGLWFHIDGAFGLLASMLPEMNDQFKGMEIADSVAFDLHKWMYMPYEVGCFLVRDPKKLQDAFVLDAGYLMKHERGIAAGPVDFKDRGPELSRGFRGLKVWMSIKEHGVDKYRRLIQQNIDQAYYLGTLVSQSTKLELTTPVSLNIVCFRYVKPKADREFNNRLNKEILMRLQESGIAMPSYAMLEGTYVIRAAITNHRSKRDDFQALVDAVIQIGNQLVRELTD